MKLTLTPIDTWFFRDSTPFEKGGAPQSSVQGVFPPYPPTIVGALRAAFAVRNGWDGCNLWSPDVMSVLGNGPDDLGRLSFTGPFVISHGLPVFPLPRHVVGRFNDQGRWLPTGVLRPGPASVLSDLGPSVRLPELQENAVDDAVSSAPAERHWVTLTGLKRILSGGLPDAEDLLREDELWAGEPRVGIARETCSRTAVKGELYSSRHVRLHPHVGIGVEIDGVPDVWKSPIGTVLLLGGESRLASCDAWETEHVKLANPAGEMGTIVLIALTPLILEHDVIRGQSALVEGVRVVSACVERAIRIGGWDSVQRTPLPLRNAVAPGSALFCEVESPETFRNALKDGLWRIGLKVTAGFGLCAVGNAPTWKRTI